MIDPIHTLAFSVQGNPGVYALLLGSGVSRASGIPTGWEITLDLVQKLAAVHDEDPGTEPESWYHEKYGKDPDYSDLLDQLTRTPAERQQLLRRYFEPNDQEREEGKKQPTAAHRAISALAAQGYVRVIITTNFDCLIENALREAGIEPTVLSTPDQVHGALPLIHTQCCVIKLHGDYLDTRIRNTLSELQSYPPEFDSLLDRVLDEFGLIVCGWSAEWDEALRKGIYRCQSRRFATYWAVHREPSEEARKLIGHRRAEAVPIDGADAFFQALQEYVQAVEDFSRPHPLSTEATVAALKRYMSESRYRIQLSELVNDAVTKVLQRTSGDDFGADAPAPRGDLFAARVRNYDAACSTLLAMAPIAGHYAKRDNFALWERALLRLATTDERGGYTVWLSFRRYPALLLLLGLGIGAIEDGRLDFVGRLFNTAIYDGNRGNVPAVLNLPDYCLPGEAGDLPKSLPGMEREPFPMNEWVRRVIRQGAMGIIPGESQFTMSYAKLEILLSLGFAYHGASVFGDWAPFGSYVRLRDQRTRILQEIRHSLTTMQNESPFVESRIFGDTADVCRNGIDSLEGRLASIPRFGLF